MSSQAQREHPHHRAHGPAADHTDHVRPDRPGGGARAGHAGHGPASWAMAAKATLHCLVGCAVGEVLGMVVGTVLGWHILPTMALAIGLAFLFGYSFTLLAVLRAGLPLRAALRVALAADTLSITVMELVDNSVIALTPGAIHAHVSDGLFWATLAFAFAVAFAATTPVNRWLIGRGKGHAVVHRYH